MDHIIGVIIGFITFFIFPISEHIAKRLFSKELGNPELWFLPEFGFRLVIRNIPNETKLYDIKYQSKIIKIIPSTAYSSVSTIDETMLTETEEFFLFSGSDQVMLSFQLNNIENEIVFVHTDKLGKEKCSYPLSKIDNVICDYMANIDNKFHFDVKKGRRVNISKNDLKNYYDLISKNNNEQRLMLLNIQSVC
ncbi:hypothetical protein [Winogradskyella sp. 3972H.M.0a.05]|uniref:hypothetical protein n=1 Tax=Winogradskyella sp. 3972H.M.0a.05 TaxID=2950277 RepID=UPI0033951840